MIWPLSFPLLDGSRWSSSIFFACMYCMIFRPDIFVITSKSRCPISSIIGTFQPIFRYECLEPVNLSQIRIDCFLLYRPVFYRAAHRSQTALKNFLEEWHRDYWLWQEDLRLFQTVSSINQRLDYTLPVASKRKRWKPEERFWPKTQRSTRTHCLTEYLKSF